MINNRLVRTAFIILIFIGFFLRFYNLRANTQFDWDQEYSVSYPAWEIIVNRHFPLIGAKSQIGDLYLAPLYTYLAAVFYFLFKLDPISGAMLAGFISVSTLISGYFLIKFILNKNIAFFFLLISSTSTYLLDFDRIPWNVNLLPLTSILVFSGLWKLNESKWQTGWLLVGLGGFLGLNSHFSVIILYMAVFLYTIILNRSAFNKYCFIAIGINVIGISPLLIFNLRHNQILTSNLLEFYLSFLNNLNYSNILNIFPFLSTTLGKLFMYDGSNWEKNIIFYLFIAVLFLGRKESNIRLFFKLFFIYLAAYIFVFNLYKREILEYYFAGLYPIFLLGISLIYYYYQKLNTRINYLLLTVLIIFSLRSFIKIQTVNTSGLGVKQQIVKYIKNKNQNQSIHINYDMELSSSYGFNYLLDYYKLYKADFQNAEIKVWLSRPISRYPTQPEYFFGDYALGTNNSLDQIYATKKLILYNGLFQLRIPKQWSILQCQYLDEDRYLLTSNNNAACNDFDSIMDGISIYNLSNCNIWDIASKKPLELGSNIPYYQIDKKELKNDLILNPEIITTAFERNRCIIFNELSRQNSNYSSQDFLEILNTSKKL